MDKFVNIFTRAHSSRSFNDDDFADRLSSRYTVVILVGFAILVGMSSYVRNPITCWAPNQFSSSKTQFASDYCWVKNTYYLPWEKDVPKESEQRQWITYYQWIPFILLAQALLFYLPSIIWHGLNSKAGVDADNILAAAHTFSMTDKVETRERTLKMLTSQIHRFLSSRGDKKIGCDCDFKSVLSVTCCRLCGKRFGNYLLLIFLFSKFCYIGNCIGQLFLLNYVLSMKYSSFGIDIAKMMARHKDWTEDSYVAFPRVTLCDFKVRGEDMANTFRYTLQCVLPVNLYNEKIFLFQWYWMILVGSASVLSFMVWALRAAFVIDRKRFVRNHINSAVEWRKKPVRIDNAINENHANSAAEVDTVQGKRFKNKTNKDKKAKKENTTSEALMEKKTKRKEEEFRNEIDLFTTKYLRQDGAFLLRLIAHNTDNITTTDVTFSLFELWKEREKNKKDKENDSEEDRITSDNSVFEDSSPS